MTAQRFLVQTNDTLHAIMASDVQKGSLPYESKRGMKKGPHKVSSSCSVTLSP